MIRRISAGLALTLIAIYVILILGTNSSYIRTPSMYPTIPPGSEVFVTHQQHYHPGDVIEFHGNGLTWVHRLVKINSDGTIVTKGDNPQNSRDVFVPTLTTHDIVGKVTHAPHWLGFPQFLSHHPSEALGWLRAELGLTGKIIIIIIAGLVAGLLIYPRERHKTTARHRTEPAEAPAEEEPVPADA